MDFYTKKNYKSFGVLTKHYYWNGSFKCLLCNVNRNIDCFYDVLNNTNKFVYNKNIYLTNVADVHIYYLISMKYLTSIYQEFFLNWCV